MEIKPAIVRLPLARLNTQFLFWHRAHLIRPPEGESPGLRIILGKVLELVSQNTEAFHIVAVAGSFHSGERELLREAIASMFSGSKVVPLIATINPKVEGNVAEYLIADLVSAPQLPRVVTSVFSDQGVMFSRDGVTPVEFLATLKEPEEGKMAREIDQALDWMVGGR
ncbi:MAG: hypothetical protein EXR60_03910 [Dehalococcoidia bacterium]|nr:hypothetical protein [Dehalococcoidia bacterium]